ncbi:VOC family protein [Mucilaginibacter sp. 14171R-50]|uniref:VOC family protein n=1 Tax=Mucilaginibacter sp. 14171R-50 TaxID=2703789 RepID=UPI00138C9B22|nr:VOC family protein [Mucilaginibacter sp. 14171R-50]QHS55009.1 VOC family protein [Mucilaginibacter sp. 14171R-50]
MSKISAYINFRNNQCGEAMTFYQSILGGELSLMPVKGSPMQDSFPAEAQEGVLHADLTGSDFSILGTDMPNPNIQGTVGIVSLTITCANKAEVHEKFAKLADGGKVVHEVMTFFAGTMGNVVDKYGIGWGVFTEER